MGTSEEEHTKGSSEGHEHQKISGKAWGVLQFRKLRSFPFSVFFIIGNEFCERFSYYGIRAVLVLFLVNQLKFSEDTSTAIYHGFIVLCYLLPLFGAVISDSCLGKYRTILILSVVYGIGNFVMSVSAIPFVRGVNIALAVVGLTVIAMGTGGIKPCVSAFGGDQFQDSQTDMLRRFFSLFYFSINAGSVISTLLTPVLRSYVHCFDQCNCFALAFGIPAILMIVSLVVFISGTRFYIIKKPQKESASRLYFDVPVSISTALYRRFRVGKIPGKKLLHYACPKFNVEFMDDVRALLKVLVMLLPLPIFWTLFDQQGSRWTLQATRMNGRLGKFTIQPDQVQALNPILILLFIPIFETVVYPVFSKCHLLRRPLQRMVVGMVLAGLAFVVAGFVQLKLQSSLQALNAGESRLSIYNNALPSVSYHIEGFEATILNNGENEVFSSLPSGIMEITVSTSSGENISYPFELQEFNITQLYITTTDGGELDIIQHDSVEYLPDGGHSRVQVINLVENGSLSELSVIIGPEGGTSSLCQTEQLNTSQLLYSEVSEWENLTIGRYDYYIYDENSTSGYNETSVLENDFKGGAIYSIIISNNANMSTEQPFKYKLTVVEVDPPNSVSIFLQVPMYVLITAGEVMFSVTGLEFAYSQAPASMKAMCQAAWLLTVAVGNFIVLIIAESSAFEDRAIEFFFFASLIGVVTLLFAIMSYFFKYVHSAEESDDSQHDLQHDEKDESTALIPEKDSTDETEEHLDDKTDFNHSESEF